MLSCKNTQNNELDNEENQNTSTSITEKDIAALQYTEYILDNKAQTILEESAEYKQLLDLVNQIKSGDLSYFKTSKETAKGLFNTLRTNLPDALNTESILARILVLETQFLKLESLYNLSTFNKTEILEASKGFLVAFSNLNLQMNKKIELDSRNIEKP